MFGCVVAVREDALAGDGIGTPGRPVQYSTPVFWDVPKRAPACGSTSETEEETAVQRAAASGRECLRQDLAGVAAATASSVARSASGCATGGSEGSTAAASRALTRSGTSAGAGSTGRETSAHPGFDLAPAEAARHRRGSVADRSLVHARQQARAPYGRSARAAKGRHRLISATRGVAGEPAAGFVHAPAGAGDVPSCRPRVVATAAC